MQQRELVARTTLVALVAFSAISTDIYLAGMPGMVRELGVGQGEGQFTISLFMLGFGAGQLLFGPLSDFHGRKPVVTAGVILYCIASLACAAAPSFEVLLVARLLQGIAAASGPVIARAMVRDRYRAQDAARMMALLATAMAVVPVLAPVLGSWLLYWFSWRAQFALLVVFGAMVLWGLRSVAESCPSIGIGGHDFTAVFGQFARCLRNRRFAGFLLCGSAVFATMFAYIASSPFIMIELLHVAPEHFGYTFMLAGCGYMGGSFLSSILVTRIGGTRTIFYGLCANLPGALLLMLCAHLPSPSLGLVLASVVCCFAGSGLCLPNCQMGAISEFPMAAGGASAVFGCTQTAFGALAGFAVGQSWNSSLLPTASTMLFFALLASAVYVWLPRTGGGEP